MDGLTRVKLARGVFLAVYFTVLSAVFYYLGRMLGG